MPNHQRYELWLNHVLEDSFGTLDEAYDRLNELADDFEGATEHLHIYDFWNQTLLVPRFGAKV